MEQLERKEFDDDDLFDVRTFSFFELAQSINEDIINKAAWYIAEIATFFGERPQGDGSTDPAKNIAVEKLMQDFLSFLKRTELEDYSFKEIADFCIEEIKEVYGDKEFVNALIKCVEITSRVQELEKLFQESKVNK